MNRRKRIVSCLKSGGSGREPRNRKMASLKEDFQVGLTPFAGLREVPLVEVTGGQETVSGKFSTTQTPPPQPRKSKGVATMPFQLGTTGYLMMETDGAVGRVKSRSGTKLPRSNTGRGGKEDQKR